MSLHESGEVEGLTGVAGLDHPVQLRQHVLEPLELLGRQRTQSLGHVPEVRTHHLFAQPLHELVELPLRLGIGEPVVLQLLDLAGRVGGERIQELLGQAGTVLGLEAQRPPLLLEELLQPLLDLL